MQKLIQFSALKRLASYSNQCINDAMDYFTMPDILRYRKSLQHYYFIKSGNRRDLINPYHQPLHVPAIAFDFRGKELALKNKQGLLH